MTSPEQARLNDERDREWLALRMAGKTASAIAAMFGTDASYVLHRTNAIKKADCYVDHTAQGAYW